MNVYEPPMIWILSYEDLSDEEREFYHTVINKPCPAYRAKGENYGKYNSPIRL